MNLVKSALTMYLLYTQRSQALNVQERGSVMKDPLGTTVCARWEDVQRAIHDQNYQLELEDVDQVCKRRNGND